MSMEVALTPTDGTSEEGWRMKATMASSCSPRASTVTKRYHHESDEIKKDSEKRVLESVPIKTTVEARLTRDRQALTEEERRTGVYWYEGVDSNMSPEKFASQNCSLDEFENTGIGSLMHEPVLHSSCLDDIDESNSSYNNNNSSYNNNNNNSYNNNNNNNISPLAHLLLNQVSTIEGSWRGRTSVINGPETLPLHSDVIATQPTLLPLTTSNREQGSALYESQTRIRIDDDNCSSTAVFSLQSSTLAATDRLPRNNIDDITDPSAAAADNRNAASASSSNTSNLIVSSQTHSTEGLSSHTMGYTANVNATLSSGWGNSESGTISEKMETSSASHKVDDNRSEHSRRSHSTNERKDREDDDTTIQSFDSATISSPAIASIASNHAQTLPTQTATFRHPQAVETPSTVSTAPSSIDDNSLEGFQTTDRFSSAHATRSEFQHHNRVPSWEASPRQSHQFFTNDQEYPFSQAFSLAHTSHSQQSQAPNAWNTNPMQRVTSFREQQQQQQEVDDPRFGYPPMSPGDARWQQQQQQQQHFAPQLPFLPPGRATPTVDNRIHRQAPASPFNPYQQLQQRKAVGPFSHQHLVQAPLVSSPGLASGSSAISAPASTPTRNTRTQRLPPTQSPHRPGAPPSFGLHVASSQSPSANARSSSEILKTLLRKKACLYEPDTSRAVALVTWLVGRELALEHGFFSRQQLQAGVHACVADKIDSGAITRTKVNRCMQIILNSCFHYIIPRPDGTEENGEPFRKAFALEVDDESYLLHVLPEPWNDIDVDREEILKASAAEMDPKPLCTTTKKPAPPLPATALTTPQSSPRLSSVSPDKSPSRESLDGDGDLKRAVLLCFNENVRRAEDVFRCHNEFIRDTAHASHLQLSSHEWHTFFGSEAASAPYLWGNIGIPVPFSEVHGSSHVDALGMMTTDEAAKFRTSWCTKRYDHDHDLCGFAHTQVNGGWLRRNPAVHPYRDEMCPAVTTIGGGQNVFVVNACPRGEKCEFAHSVEEIIYHPRRYKMNACSSMGRPSGCHLGDVCPSFHPIDTYRFPKKADSRASRHPRHSHQASGSKGAPAPPSASPILYASPAPLSSFEKQLLVPGLQNLFRRQCSVLRAHIHRRGCTCNYSYFGDDTGINAEVTRRVKSSRGLPSLVV